MQNSRPPVYPPDLGFYFPGAVGVFGKGLVAQDALDGRIVGLGIMARGDVLGADEFRPLGQDGNPGRPDEAPAGLEPLFTVKGHRANKRTAPGGPQERLADEDALVAPAVRGVQDPQIHSLGLQGQEVPPDDLGVRPPVPEALKEPRVDLDGDDSRPARRQRPLPRGRVEHQVVVLNMAPFQERECYGRWGEPLAQIRGFHHMAAFSSILRSRSVLMGPHLQIRRRYMARGSAPFSHREMVDALIPRAWEVSIWVWRFFLRVFRNQSAKDIFCMTKGTNMFACAQAGK